DTQIAMNLRGSSSAQVDYVISSGDTLSEIAARYNVSVTELKTANRLSGNTVRVGQKLRIPVLTGT
ncbi:MAG TPA: LysM peptidoglycan-binding domain-containing protein, partial [Woeseiaceae bacterium]|nr:LysM peptidoglycan-binding domain-containing protein [Woeseiaceae bacterium]